MILSAKIVLGIVSLFCVIILATTIPNIESSIGFAGASTTLPVVSTRETTTPSLSSLKSTFTVTSTSTVTTTSTSTVTTYSSSTITSTSIETLTSKNIVQSTNLMTSTAVATTTRTSVVYVTSTQTVNSVVTQETTSTATSVTTLTETTTQSVADPISTGNSLYDHYDLTILAAASNYGLDPMILKSQIAQESYFNAQAISPDDPCGQIMQNGVDVGHSYGLMQMTPACITWFARNPDGSIDLSTNSTSPQWSNSAFNPVYNINSAAQDWYSTLQYAKQQLPGCTQTQYVYVVLSAYNAGFGSVSSCTSFSAQGTQYANNVLAWYQKFASMAGIAYPY